MNCVFSNDSSIKRFVNIGKHNIKHILLRNYSFFFIKLNFFFDLYDSIQCFFFSFFSFRLNKLRSFEIDCDEY